MKSYIITKIFEADYGCEGIPEGESMQDIVCMRADDGETLNVKVNDSELIEKNINEGDRVYCNEKGEIFKEKKIQ